MATIRDVTPSAVDALIPETILNRAMRLGPYQVDVLRNERAWSGADLAGKARSYGAVYARSRHSALAKVRAVVKPYGVDVRVDVGAHGKLSLAWTIAGLTIGQWTRAAERPGLAGMFCAGD